MPIFGKGRAKKNLPKKIAGQEFVFPGEVRRIGKERVVRLRAGYTDIRNPLEKINEWFGIDLGEEAKRTSHKLGRKIVVVDWGCGKGTAITQLQRECEKEAHCYGFSKDSYDEWIGNSFVKFIQADADDFKRYFKRIPIDLMFSYAGLAHYAVKANLPEYLIEIKNNFRVGGKLYTNNLYLDETEKKILEENGWKVDDVKSNSGVYSSVLTRIK